jgi:hypothetical protein
MDLVLLLVVLAVAVSGCGGSGSADRPPASGANATSSGAADPAVCDSVDTLFARMRARSVTWIPADKPFDKVTAAAVANLSGALVGQEQQARTAAVRTALGETAAALERLHDAMDHAQSRRDVLDAVAGVRRSYSTLKGSCGLSNGTPADNPRPAGPGASSSPSQATPRGAACREVQSIMVRMGAASARWSPAKRPFDPTAAAAFRRLARELGGLQTSAPDRDVRSAIEETAAAFAGIPRAMASEHRGAVNRSLVDAQRAYRNIKLVCDLPSATTSE